MEADYATEIEENGSLTIPSAEPRHTGIYQLVAENSAGSMEKEVKVFVHVDGEATPDVQKRFMVLQAVSVGNFGRFVADNHSNNNRGFRDQYAVRRHSSVVFVLITNFGKISTTKYESTLNGVRSAIIKEPIGINAATLISVLVAVCFKYQGMRQQQL